MCPRCQDFATKPRSARRRPLRVREAGKSRSSRCCPSRLPTSATSLARQAGIQKHHRDERRPGARAQLSIGIHGPVLVEESTDGAVRKEHPCRRQVIRAIARTHVTEVDDGNEVSVLNQDVRGMQVGVQPDPWALRAWSDGARAPDSAQPAWINLAPHCGEKRSKVSARLSSDAQPRNALNGASAGAGMGSARRNVASHLDESPVTLSGLRSPGSPVRNGTIDHGQGKRAPGRPARTGVGTGKGSASAMNGNQRCSLSVSATAASRRGSRTMRASPLRHSSLSQPASIRTAGVRGQGAAR